MRKKWVTKSCTIIAVQVAFLTAAPAVTPTQSAAPRIVQPTESSRIQPDPYADAFAGLTYTEQQKATIDKIQQDVASRKAAVLKADKLTDAQKDAMLTGYTRMKYGLIYKELTPAQKKQVSIRMRALRDSNEAARKTQAPAR